MPTEEQRTLLSLIKNRQRRALHALEDARRFTRELERTLDAETTDQEETADADRHEEEARSPAHA